ncbi:hypothetical protein M758_1G071900 [Ceratodon purpureus]|uniref:Uncharacterized protein n=1 Tax=Ceratodon purpureus TaxID=3225 RepID=A0A8T0J5D1_CERPU|nr:hypothetical protein KC19_1G073300 [Ceratodon purpureus]KAG0629030.1 hypothetical protein M758_1G071900 [Ceratodon purpureus]
MKRPLAGHLPCTLALSLDTLCQVYATDHNGNTVEDRPGKSNLQPTSVMEPRDAEFSYHFRI